MVFADHAIALVLVVLAPLWGRRSWRRLQRALANGREEARLSAYAGTILLEWSLAIVVLVAWIALGRPLASAGLSASLAWPFVITLALAAALGALLLGQVRAVRGLDAAGRASLQRQLAPVQTLLPHTAGERDVCLALSLTAGFCEELLYRGFLIGYLSPAAGIAGAVAASAVVFGLVHGYQGRGGILKTGAIGLVMGLIYAVSGSVWPAVVLHAAFDVQGGLIGYEVFSRAGRQVGGDRPARPGAVGLSGA